MEFALLEFALIVFVFAFALLCHYCLSNRTRFIWDIICLVLTIGIIIFLGIRLFFQWQANADITTLLVVYILFVIGCIVHFVCIFAKNRHDQSCH